MDSPGDRIGPFVEGVVVTLRELAGVEAIAGPTARAGPAGADDLTAAVRLTMVGEGLLALRLPPATAAELARRVLAGAAEADDGMVQDCAGELVNVAAGQTKALLYGTPDHFTFSTPVVGTGPAAGPTGGWMVSFDSEAGAFHLHVSLPG